MLDEVVQRILAGAAEKLGLSHDEVASEAVHLLSTDKEFMRLTVLCLAERLRWRRKHGEGE